MKFCKDCKWMELRTDWFTKLEFCMNPKFGFIDRVNGNFRLNSCTCESRRELHSLTCGFSGHDFEKKK